MSTSSPKPEAHPAIIQTTAGPVQGFTESAHRTPQGKKASPPVLKYLGVPYAQAARFARPTAPTPWRTPLAAFDFGPSFPQLHNPYWDLIHARSHLGRLVSQWPQSEAAHTVNIWRPVLPPDARPSPAERLPVLVWIYGGGLENGSTEEPVYEMENLVRRRAAAGQPILVVSANYRTNVFGFCCGPGWAAIDAQAKAAPAPGSIDGARDGGRAGNYGLYDAIAALEWVQANIAAFGGDPGNVTAVGESAGAFIVSVLLTHRARLFDRAILHSGAPNTMPIRRPGASYVPYKTLVQQFCPTATTEAARRATLAALPAAQLLEAHAAAPGGAKVGVTLETGAEAVFTDATLRRLARGELAPWVQSVVIGTDEDEGTVFSFMDPLAFSSDGVVASLGRQPPAVRAQAARLFPSNPDAEKARDFTRAPAALFRHHLIFGEPARMLAETLHAASASASTGDGGSSSSSSRAKIYVFRFQTVMRQMLWGSGRSNYGAPHGTELAASFAVDGLLSSAESEGGAAEWRAAHEMSSRWGEYVATGTPGAGWEEWKGEQGSSGSGNGNGNGRWLVFTPEGAAVMRDCPAETEQMRFVRKFLVGRDESTARKWDEMREKGLLPGAGQGGNGVWKL